MFNTIALVVSTMAVAPVALAIAGLVFVPFVTLGFGLISSFIFGRLALLQSFVTGWSNSEQWTANDGRMA